MKDYTYTELDQQLQEMAVTDWIKFVELIGLDSINKAKICLMKKQQRTLKYMAYRTKMPLSTVGLNCKRCPENI
jgi:hypothetical protein